MSWGVTKGLCGGLSILVAAALEQRFTVGGDLPGPIGVAPQVVAFDVASAFKLLVLMPYGAPDVIKKRDQVF